MQEKDAQRLLEKFRAGQCTEEEKIRLRNWFHTVDSAQESHLTAEELGTIGQEMWAELNAQTQPITIKRMWPRYAAAASILLIAGAAWYFIKPKEVTHDVAPFTATAILKTHGKTIILEKVNGKIAPLIRKEGEQLTYLDQQGQVASYDTIEIPKGGRPYTINLTDGSKIILNAATTLRYPNNKRADIELIDGEIYAEIVHNAKQPINIEAPGQNIHDIGTEININAYKNEPQQRTTLVEGNITVNNTRLKAGQQAINGELNTEPFDLEQTVAWKKGDFNFRGEHIDVIMRELARWYDIDVVYGGKMTNEVFYLQLTRKRNISSVLHALEKTKKVKFKIEGRRVTVISKT